MSDYVKLDDTVYFIANFYHPLSGYSMAADSTPAWLVYEDNNTSSMLTGSMTARTNIPGVYYGSFVANTANGFETGKFYDVQVSGVIWGAPIYTSIKQFSLDKIYDVNLVKVSGLYISPTNTMDANVTKVSGVSVSLADFNTGGTGVSASEIWGYADRQLTSLPSGAIADAIWNDQISQHQVIGTTGYALNAASGNFIGTTAVDPASIWGYATRTLTSIPSGAIADAVWDEIITTHNISETAGNTLMLASGILNNIIRADVVKVSGEFIIGTSVVNANIVQVSGIPVSIDETFDANIVSVSGVNVTLSDFNTGGGGATAAQVWSYADRQLTSFPSGSFADAIWNESISEHQVIGTTGYALNTASGNLIGIIAAPTASQIRQEIDTNSVQLISLSGIVGAVKVKTDYLPSVTPGLTGGLFKVGQNNPISIVGTGTALYIESTGNNGNGVFIAGHGTGSSAYIYSNNGIALDIYSNFASAAVKLQGGNGYGMQVVGGGSFDIYTISNAGSWQGNSTHTADDVWTSTTRTLTSIPSGAIADAVWNDTVSQHQTAGTMGYALNIASGQVGGDATLANQTTIINHLTDIKGIGWSAATDSLEQLQEQGNTIQTTITNEIVNNIIDVNIVQVSGQSVSINSFKTDISGLDQDVYFAVIKYIADATNNRDEFAVHWFKNDQPVSSGSLTNPRISVYNTATGSVIINGQAMSYASPNVGVVRYNTAVTLLASGEPYLVETSGTINSAMRTWRSIVGVDLL